MRLGSSLAVLLAAAFFSGDAVADIEQAMRDGCAAHINGAVWNPRSLIVLEFGPLSITPTTLEEHLGITHPRAAELREHVLENNPDFSAVVQESIALFEGVSWSYYQMPITFRFVPRARAASTATTLCTINIADRLDAEGEMQHSNRFRFDGLSATQRTSLGLRDDF